MAPVRFSDPGSTEDALRRLPDMEVLGLLRRSSNYTFLAALKEREQAGDSLLVVYKPKQGESPLWDFQEGTLYRREVAAYVLARHLGWPKVPPTVIRHRAPHGVGAVQLFIDAQPGSHYLTSRGTPAELWIEVAVFDVIVNNADRKSGHCLTDGEGQIWMIDHGLTFHVEPKLRTVIWDFAGHPLPSRLCADLESAAASLQGGELGAQLGELLAAAELRMLRRRLVAAVSRGWQLPHPTSAWSVPWPPI